MDDSPPKEFPSVGLIALNLVRVWYQSLGSFSQLVNGKPPRQRSSDLSAAVAVTIAVSIFNKLILYAFLRMVCVTSDSMLDVQQGTDLTSLHKR
jgi:hypothetical protein